MYIITARPRRSCIFGKVQDLLSDSLMGKSGDGVPPEICYLGKGSPGLLVLVLDLGQ